MKAITVYLSDGGEQFNTAAAAAARDFIDQRVAQLVALLKPHPADNYVQQDLETAVQVQRALVHLYVELNPSYADNVHMLWQLDVTMPAAWTIVGRFMDECGIGSLRGAWYRIMCMDQRAREWSQPYYARQANDRLGFPSAV